MTYFRISIFNIQFFLFCVVLILTMQNCASKQTFLYFGYGSNLLAQRIHINSPSAVRRGAGVLKDYRLDFNLFSKRWKGASATVVPDVNKKVWGAIWEIDTKNLPNLDLQEGVDANIYFPFDATIEMVNGTIVKCRCYQQTINPPNLKDGEIIPQERLPSAVYLNTIIKGAAETGLPETYQQFLKSLPHNGYDGKVEIQIDLNQ